MLIGIPAETRAGETRVAATAETVKKLVAAGHTVMVESGAGVAALRQGRVRFAPFRKVVEALDRGRNLRPHGQRKRGAGHHRDGESTCHR